MKSGTGVVAIASASGYTGTTRILAGTLQIGNGGTTGVLGSGAVQNDGVLAFNRTDNISVSNAISGTGQLTQSGTGELTLSGTNTYTGSTNLNAGALVFSAFTNIGSGSINFNGGALKFGSGVTTDISSRTINLGAGGGTINTNGNNVTFANSIGNGGAGALTKAGAGRLTLAGGSYSGLTNVTGGTLVANGSYSGGASVADTATLGGSGTFGGTITVASGATIAPGNSVGTITAAGLSLANNSILNYEFNTTPANDYISVTGNSGLTINGGGFNLYQENTVNPFSTVGTYNLIGYSGSIGGTGVSALTVLNPQAGKNYNFSATGSDVTLDISSAGLISDWNVDADGSWNNSGNWSNTVPNATSATAQLNASLTANRAVTLDGDKTVAGLTIASGSPTLGYTVAQGSSGSLSLDSGGTQANVNVNSGANTISANVTLGSSNAVFAVAANSSLTASGELGGSGALVKSGSGTLNLTGNSNTYSGGTTVAGGTLGFSGLGSLGSGNIAIDGGTLRYNSGNTDDISARTVTIGTSGATFDTNGNDVAFANAIGNSGAGGLTKTGSGTLTLSGENTYTGPTSVTGGSVSIAGNAGLGAPASGSGLTLNGGTLATTSSLALDNAGANNRAVTIGSSGGAFNVADSTTLTVSGTVSGSSGTLTKSGGGTLTLSGNNATTLSSAINLVGGTLQAGGAQSNGQQGLGTGAITLGNGTTLRANGAGLTDNGTGYGTLANALTVASGSTATLVPSKRMTISSSLSGAGTLNVQVDGTRQDYTGNWSAFTGQLNLNGAGEFRLGGANSFTNASVHLGNGVYVYQSYNPPSGTGTETVQNIGALSGDTGSILGGQPVGGRYVNWTVGSLGTSTVFAGVIQNDTDSSNGFGEPKLTKVGAGTLTLSGVNTYTGPTTVSAGALRITGSLANTAVTVGASGTLSGTGTIGGATTINGALRPNSAPTDATSRLTFGSTLALAGTTTFDIDGGNYTGVTVSTANSLSYGGTLTVNFGGATVPGTYDLFNFTTLTGGTFSSLSFGGTFATPTWTTANGVWTGVSDGYTFEFREADGDLLVSAVPEPSAFALLAGLAGLGCVGLRRRRRA